MYRGKGKCTLPVSNDNHASTRLKAEDDTLNTDTQNDGKRSQQENLDASLRISQSHYESSVLHNTSYNVKETDMNDADESSPDVTATITMLNVTEASEQLFNNIRECLLRIQDSIDKGPKMATICATVICGTGSHTKDYLIELCCIVMFLKVLLKQVKLDDKRNRWITKIFTDALRVLCGCDFGANRKIICNMKKSEALEFITKIQKNCEVPINTLSEWLKQSPNTWKCRKHWHDLQHLFYDQSTYRCELQDDENVFTAMLSRANLIYQE